MSEQTSLSEHDLTAAFRDLGLGPGHGVMVHSSLSSFGRVADGPETVIRALMATVTEEGTLLFPSFNHFMPFWKDGPGIYDPAVTPTSNGIIPDTFWRMPGVYRSLNPSHAYAAWGRDAERYTATHHLTLTMGPESPLGLLGNEGGYALFLGTDYLTNTYKHVVETTLGAPCLGYRTEELPTLLPDGRRVRLRTWSYREKGCPISDPHKHVDAEMTSRGLHARARVGLSTLTLLKLADCFRVMAEMLQEGYAGFPPCSECPIRPSSGPHSVESDWDPNAGTLRPDSESLRIGPLAYVSPGRT